MLTIVRHAECTSNVGDDRVDSPLTDRGIMQAADLTGTFDLVVCSPLMRARQTLERSRIEAGRIFHEPLCRERVYAPRDCLVDEPFQLESDDHFAARLDRFRARLVAWTDVFDRVLVVSHAYFLASCFPSHGRGIVNAQLVRIEGAA